MAAGSKRAAGPAISRGLRGHGRPGRGVPAPELARASGGGPGAEPLERALGQGVGGGVGAECDDAWRGETVGPGGAHRGGAAGI